MTVIADRRRWAADYAMPLATGLMLLILSYAHLFARPYVGFSYLPSAGTVVLVYVPSQDLFAGDTIVSIGPVTMDQFNADLRRQFFEDVQPGEVVPIVVQRAGGPETIEWVIPGPTRREIWERLFGNWLAGVAVFGAAAVGAVFARPRDLRRQLLIAFLCLTAVWLTASAASPSHALFTPFLMRSAIWLTVPVAVHLHWHIPAPLARLPWPVWAALYGLAALCAVAEWFRVLPPPLYQAALLAMLLISLGLLLVQIVRHPSRRRQVGLLALLMGLTITPILGVALARLIGLRVNAAYAVLFMLALPYAYVVAILLRQLGDMQFRVNQALSRMAFFILLATVGLVVTPLASASTQDPSGALLVGLMAGLSTAIVTSGLQRPFERWFQRRFLGMRLPPDTVLGAYSTRIASSLTVESLTAFLARDVLPSLLVREALLLQLDERGQAAPILVLGVDDSNVPSSADRAVLVAESGRYHAPEGSASLSCPWVRVAFALRANEQLVGLLLLGRRDPDDYYDQAELDQIGTLAQQIAVVLSHIALTQQLRDLNQHTMSVSEAERGSLARELHDGPLSRLSLQLQRLPPDTPADVRQGIQEVIASLRRTASGLRPPALDFGLHAALRSLALDLKARTEPETDIVLDVPPSAERYDPQVELHIYRIAQQAGHNATRHAHARTITIAGELAPGCIDLTFGDDGWGFDTGKTLELGWLLGQGHFGLAGMHERARAVGARLELLSAPGAGTRVRVRWEQTVTSAPD